MRIRDCGRAQYGIHIRMFIIIDNSVRFQTD